MPTSCSGMMTLPRRAPGSAETLPMKNKTTKFTFAPADFIPFRDTKVTALKHCEAVMSGQSDPLIPNEAVAIALMWHLMGDLHQPLHCTTDYYPNQPSGQHKTDIGGNNVAVSNFVDPYPNFHSLWDGALEGAWDDKGNRFVVPDEADPFTITATSPLLVDKVNEVVSANTIPPADLGGDYVAWARETHAT